MIETRNFFGLEFPLASAWTYALLSRERGHEFSFWDPRFASMLCAHLHDEVQLTFVFSGERRFLVGAAFLEARAGEIAVVPANVPHCALDTSRTSTLSFDLFMKPDAVPGLSQMPAAAMKMSRRLRENAALSSGELETEIAGLVDIHAAKRAVSDLGERFIDLVENSDKKISVLAETAGLSRESFIRAFRREVGMTPHAYRIARRAKAARQQLRSGCSPAAVAADSGFADQSHLGRVFKKSFGTTPAIYRSVWQG